MGFVFIFIIIFIVLVCLLSNKTGVNDNHGWDD